MPGGITSRGFGVNFFGGAGGGGRSEPARLGQWASWSRDYSMFIQFIQWSLVVSFGLFLVVPRLGGCGWAWVWAILLCDNGTFLVFPDFLRSWVFFSCAGKAQSAARMLCFFFLVWALWPPPSAKMPWGYLSVKMWMYKRKNSSLKYIQNIGTSIFKYD